MVFGCSSLGLGDIMATITIILWIRLDKYRLATRERPCYNLGAIVLASKTFVVVEVVAGSLATDRGGGSFSLVFDQTGREGESVNNRKRDILSQCPVLTWDIQLSFCM